MYALQLQEHREYTQNHMIGIHYYAALIAITSDVRNMVKGILNFLRGNNVAPTIAPFRGTREIERNVVES